MNWRILEGDAAERLRDLDPQSVQTCITSPPYWGLRDYGTATWEGGDAECDHGPTAASRETRPASGLTGGKATVDAGTIRKGDCSCGATRIDSQLGLEPTPEEYVANLVEVFREVRRVLRDDGTLWLNLGDSYAARLRQSGEDHAGALSAASKGVIKQGAKPLPVGLKEKDLVGIPWMVAFALRADGWVLRQEVIWQKPNPMPESVTDRCTKSHEQLFMFSKAKWTGMEPGEFAHISEQDARWLALFFDAEGSLVLRRERDGARHAAQISLGSTCRPLLEAAQRIVGAGNILERDGKNAPMFYWQLSNKRARDLLLRLHPYLIVKQQQARCLIDLESRKWKRGDNRNGLSASEMAYRERLWEAVKSLNSFGSPDLSWVPEPKIGRWGAGPRYFYDAEAIREEFIEAAGGEAVERGEHGSANARAGANGSPDRGNRHGFPRAHTGRNKRSVWTVTTQPFPGAHFATFPPKLIEPCILAGSPPKCCGECGAPWERVREKTGRMIQQQNGPTTVKAHIEANGPHGATSSLSTGFSPEYETTGWQPTCGCGLSEGVKGATDNGGRAATVAHSLAESTVLDPFSGAGTTGVVALRHDRSYVGIELNPEYAEMSRQRIYDDAPLLNVEAV